MCSSANSSNSINFALCAQRVGRIGGSTREAIRPWAAPFPMEAIVMGEDAGDSLAPFLKLGSAELGQLALFLSMADIARLLTALPSSLSSRLLKLTTELRYNPSTSRSFTSSLEWNSTGATAFFSQFPALRMVKLIRLSYLEEVEAGKSTPLKHLPPTLTHLQIETTSAVRIPSKGLLHGLNFGESFPLLEVCILDIPTSDWRWVVTLPPTLLALATDHETAGPDKIFAFACGLMRRPPTTDEDEEVEVEEAPVATSLPFPSLLALEIATPRRRNGRGVRRRYTDPPHCPTLAHLPPTVTRFSWMAPTSDGGAELSYFLERAKRMETEESLAHKSSPDPRPSCTVPLALPTSFSSTSFPSSSVPLALPTSSSSSSFPSSSSTPTSLSSSEIASTSSPSSSSASKSNTGSKPSSALRSLRLFKPHDALFFNSLMSLPLEHLHIQKYDERVSDAKFPLSPSMTSLQLSDYVADLGEPGPNVITELHRKGIKLHMLEVGEIALSDAPDERRALEVNSILTSVFASLKVLHLQDFYSDLIPHLPADLEVLEWEYSGEEPWTEEQVRQLPPRLTRLSAASARIELGHVPLLPRSLLDLKLGVMNSLLLGTRFVTPEMRLDGLPYDTIEPTSNLLFGLPPCLRNLAVHSPKNFETRLGLFLPRCLLTLSPSATFSMPTRINLRDRSEPIFGRFIGQYIGLSPAPTPKEELIAKIVSYFPPGCICSLEIANCSLEELHPFTIRCDSK